ncbi:MAG TPA: zf-HC2 domain-containing protein [Thermoanaerobaculia bacterium]|nr:zf-HC2 domain-containing protein [Thermoanaerobaculia bacterium]
MTDHGCPDAVVLAAFAEGALDVAERVAVEHHVANCPECPGVISEVTLFLQETQDDVADEPPPSPPRQIWWYIAAAVAALCIPFLVWTVQDPMRGVRRIAAQLPARPFEGRLHDLPYAPFEAPRDGGDRPKLPLALLHEARRLAGLEPNTRVLRARGILALCAHDPRAAVDVLRRASQASPHEEAVWNDLAVAEIARAAVERDEQAALTAALDAANRALVRSPSSRDAQFNRALALELLGHHAKAIKAWRALLDHEKSVDWRTEITAHLQRLGVAN